MGLSSGVMVSYILPFHTVHGVSQPEYWSEWPFPPPVGHVLSELFTMSYLSWVALRPMAQSFSELHKPVRHVKAMIHEGAMGVGPHQWLSGIGVQYAEE